MKKRSLIFKSLILTLCLVLFQLSCSHKKTVSDDNFEFENESENSMQNSESESDKKDEFAEFDKNPDENAESSSAASSTENEPTEFEKALEDSNDKEIALEEQPPQDQASNSFSNPDNTDLNNENLDSKVSTDSQNLNVNNNQEGLDNPPQPEVVSESNTDNSTASNDSSNSSQIEVEPSLSTQDTPESSVNLSKVVDVKFISNHNGGTLIIKTDKETTYKTRVNNQSKQLVIEVENVVVPDHLKRPLIMRDMSSNIKSVDVYQSKKSSIGRFVVQLNELSVDPLVQPEGSSILVMANRANENQQNQEIASSSADESSSATNQSEGMKVGETLMTSDNLEDFLMNNNKYYGKQISIEVTDLDIRDILKFIADESGINMIFDDNISGKGSYKLRNVPWDQALVTILKSKKLGYRRQGEILRIAPVEVLAKEEEDAVRLKDARKKVEPLIVKNFQINYADIGGLESKIKEFIKEDELTGASGVGTAVNRGRVTTDARTNTLIVTDTASKIQQVEQLIAVLDSQPQQVLIEGRVVEASETYSRAMGFNYGLNTGDGTITGSNRVVTNLGNSATSSNPINISPSMTFTPSSTGSFTSSLWFGQLGAFGDLSAKLTLDESESKIKILSSPRVTVLHNQSANINQTVVIRVPSTSTESSTTGATTQTYKDVPVGVKFDVKPIISSVGTVNLDMKIEKSATNSDGNITQRDMKTNIIVKDGDTAIIGGVFTSEATDGKTGIPGLKDIPILGTLFRSQSDSKSKTELMFFVSPKILKNLILPSASNQVSQKK